MLSVTLSYSRMIDKKRGCIVRNDVIKYNFLIELWVLLN